jgi:hypothetical protein
LHALGILPLLKGKVETIAVGLNLHVASAKADGIIIHAHAPEHHHCH